LGTDLSRTAQTIKEVLLSGSANRLIAELTCVRVDDLAAPLPKPGVDAVLEPLVAIVIVVNAATIGVQSDSDLEQWHGWIWFEVCFIVIFASEILMKIWTRSFRVFFMDDDWAWNAFDVFIVFIAVFDIFITVVAQGMEIPSLTVLRMVRLTRLTRLIRLFRFQAMQELRLMVNGLIAGLRTLFWAIVLLFFMIYIIAVFATVTIGQDVQRRIIKGEELLTTVPNSMLTAFRCFTGDCATATGKPIAKLLSDEYGARFILPYVAAVVMITFGLFNLIMAIYVENTISAARLDNESNKTRRDRESLRVAHVTKQLLKKICAAYQTFSGASDTKSSTGTGFSVKDVDIDDVFQEITDDMVVSKELFLLLVQDQEIQALLDALNVPPDRAHLFDVLDADDSGGLHIEELVQGLLKVRGDTRKSDQVACLLATKALHQIIRTMGDDIDLLKGHFGLYSDEAGPRHVRSKSASAFDPRQRKSDGSSTAT